MRQHVEIRSARAGLIAVLLSLIVILGFRLTTGRGVPALEYPLVPIVFLGLFVIGFMLGVISFVRGTLRRRVFAAVLTYALAGLLSLPILALIEMADGSLTVEVLLQEVTDVRFYLGLIVLWPTWPLLLLDTLGIFIIFHRI